MSNRKFSFAFREVASGDQLFESDANHPFRFEASPSGSPSKRDKSSKLSKMDSSDPEYGLPITEDASTPAMAELSNMMTNNLFRRSDSGDDYSGPRNASRNDFMIHSPTKTNRATNLLEQSILSPDRRHQWVGSFGNIHEKQEQLDIKAAEEDFGILDQEIARFAKELLEKQSLEDSVQKALDAKESLTKEQQEDILIEIS